MKRKCIFRPTSCIATLLALWLCGCGDGDKQEAEGGSRAGGRGGGQRGAAIPVRAERVVRFIVSSTDSTANRFPFKAITV